MDFTVGQTLTKVKATIVPDVIYRYLDCGILHNGFARDKFDGKFSITPGIPTASPFCKGGLRGIF